MTAAPLLAAILAATDPTGHQSTTERMRQVESARRIAEALPFGANVEDAAKLTGRLGEPEVSYLRCSGGTCNKAFDEMGASVRVHTWEIADQYLYLVFCGRRAGWHLATVDLTPARLRQFTAEDEQATFARRDEEQAKACQVE